MKKFHTERAAHFQPSASLLQLYSTRSRQVRAHGDTKSSKGPHVSAYLDGNGSEREIVKCNRKIDDRCGIWLCLCLSLRALSFNSCHNICLIIFKDYYQVHYLHPCVMMELFVRGVCGCCRDELLRSTLCLPFQNQN